MAFPQRKPNRLPHFDYSAQGGYFVTICTHNRKNTLSDIVGDGSPVPKTPGQIAKVFIAEIPEKYPCVHVDNYVIMPNHIHLLLQIENSGETQKPSPALGDIIGWYKYQVTKSVNAHYGTIGARFFQRSYHDHVIRGEGDYFKIWEYIDSNPARWKDDCFYTEEPDEL